MATPLRQMHQILLRPAATVMQLGRLGSFHQCRLSFMRTLLRRFSRENWTFERTAFDINDTGVGTAVYAANAPAHTYSLICFSHDLAPELRSDRVIAHAWDATFALFDGVPTASDIERLSNNVPRQEAGRITSKEMTLSRANRSTRLFDHVVESLAAGRQPDRDKVEAVGYLMRTTAVYGSGKFGAADREALCDRPELGGSFQAEMLTVFLIRAFVLDLVEHLARTRSPETAVVIDPALRRRFGIGNSTGLGLAPFIINHPVLLNNWIRAREVAFHRVRSLPAATSEATGSFQALVERARASVSEWRSEHPVQKQKLALLDADLRKLDSHCSAGALAGPAPWDRLYGWAEEHLSIEGQEYLVSLALEPYSELVDDLADTMEADESEAFPIDGSMSLDRLKEIVEDVYDWALLLDWTDPENIARVWYVSEEKLEPRLGERFDEPIEPYEQPLAPGRDAADMYHAMTDWNGGPGVAEFLLCHPEHRHMVRRAQIAARFPYAEIRDNTISSQLLPIDLLRCKLAFFGATHFDPRSDRWVRINMFRDAPFPHEIETVEPDDWAFPALGPHHS